jgi:hypothetical protein
VQGIGPEQAGAGSARGQLLYMQLHICAVMEAARVLAVLPSQSNRHRRTVAQQLLSPACSYFRPPQGALRGALLSLFELKDSPIARETRCCLLGEFGLVYCFSSVKGK